jgi:hypothetical protein
MSLLIKEIIAFPHAYLISKGEHYFNRKYSRFWARQIISRPKQGVLPPVCEIKYKEQDHSNLLAEKKCGSTYDGRK